MSGAVVALVAALAWLVPTPARAEAIAIDAAASDRDGTVTQPLGHGSRSAPVEPPGNPDVDMGLLAQAPEVPTGSDPEEDIDRILDGPDYAGVSGTNLGDRIGEAWAWLQDAFRRAFFGASDVPGTGWAGIALLVAVVAALIWGVVRGGRRTARDRQVARETPTAPAGPDEWERRARAAADGGDLEAAVHLAFRALAIRHGVLTHRPDEPGRTAGEVRRAAADTPYAEPVAGAADAFEAVAYGGRVATQADVTAIEQANAVLRRAGPNLVRTTP